MRQVSSLGSIRQPRSGRVLITLLGFVIALLAVALPLAEKADAAKKPPRVTIRTTEYGIPRILADKPYGLGYGYGWAIASQQLCTLADTYTTVRGERSLYFGAETKAPNNISNLDSDFFWKRVRLEGTVKKMMNLKPPNGPEPDVKQVVKGYVAGYNAYLKKTGVKKLPDPTCRGKSWVKPITILDAYMRFFQLLGYGSADPSMDGIAQAQPPSALLTKADQAAAESGPDLSGITPEDFGPDFGNFTGGLGSNAVALGKNSVAGGKGLLLGNPHFPWHGAQRFFESQLTIPGKLNVSGASLLGVPVALIGHTRNMAWSHTVSTARRFVIFQERLDPADPTRYIVDGQSKPMKRTAVTVTDDKGTKYQRTLYSTEHGYVTNSVQGTPLFDWSPSYAYTLYDANSGNFRMINHFYAMSRAQSTPQVLKILKKYQGIPWVNTIATDSKGRALYADIGAVPDASDERIAECNTGIGALSWPSFRLPVFDGSKSSCDMSRKSPGAAGPGLLPATEMPYLMRSDYVENSNDSYWLSNVKKPLEGFDRIIGEERIAQTERTRLAHKMVNEQLSSGKFTLGSLKAMLYNGRVESAELLLDQVVAYCRANPILIGESGPVTTGPACDAMAGWDGRNNLDSTGGLFFQRFAGRLYSGASGLVYSTPFNYQDPVGTPSGLNTTNPDLPTALADTIAEFSVQGIPFDATRRDYQTVTRQGQKIPLPAGDYEPYGSFNPVWGPWEPGKGITEISDGSSFIQAVHLTGAKCPKASMILTYSQSENPKSKHYADQTRLYSKKGWAMDRFCPGQQKKSPGLKVKRFGGGAKAERKGL